MRFLFPSTLHNYWHVHWKKVLSAAKVYCLLAERPSTQMSSYIRYAFSINQTSLAVRWCNKIKTKKEEKKKKSCEREARVMFPATLQWEQGTKAGHSNKIPIVSRLLLLESLFSDTVEGWLTDAINRCRAAATDASWVLLTHCGRCCPSIHPPPLAGGKGRWPLQPCHLEPANRAKQWEQTQTMGLYPKAVLWAHLPELGLPLLPVKHVYARQR